MEYKFRAWVEKTTNNKFNYAYKKSIEKFVSHEPDKYDIKWNKWYDVRNQYQIHLENKWDKIHSEKEEYTTTNEMTTDIYVNKIVTHSYNCVVLDTMQFTGFIDNNNKDIYVGDILFDGEGILIVKFNDEKGAFVLEDYKRNDLYYFDDFYSIPNVIGNIYENKELLKLERE